jgi:hypothetical protein
MKPFLILISSILLVLICGTKSISQDLASDKQDTVSNLTEHPGYNLYQMYCIACHGNAATPEKRLAPPAFMVNKRYKIAYDKEAFVERVVAWIDAPSTEKSIMPGAVRNFNLMPPLPLSLNDREKIADYFYEAEFEEPTWFAEHQHGTHGVMRGKN